MKIYPREKIDGVFEVPSDKYETICAVLLSSLIKGKTTIVGNAYYGDVASALSSAKKLGAKVKRKGDIIEIRGAKILKQGTYRFDCGNSGATMRLLCGISAGSDINAVLTGGKYLSKRDMKGVKEPLEKMGATVALTGYAVPPIWVEGASDLKRVEIDDENLGAQEKASVLFGALCGKTEAVIYERVPTDDSAEIVLKAMGADIKVNGEKIILKPSELTGGNTVNVAGDIHAANLLIALGVMMGKVTVKSVAINPRKRGFIEILRRMGADISFKNERKSNGELIADVTAVKSKLKATHVGIEEAKTVADDLPLLAVVMGLSEGESIIVDATEFSDCVPRAETINELINSIGGKCEKFDGGVLIKGALKYSGGNVKTGGDHRIASATVVALLSSENGGEVDDENAVNSAFPKFIETLTKTDVGVIGKGYIADEVRLLHSYILDRIGVKSYSVSRFNLRDDNQKRVLAELKDHVGYSAFYPYCVETLRSVRKLSSVASSLKTTDAATKNKGYSFTGNGLLLALKFIGEDLSGKKVLVIGSGSAGKSVIHSLISIKAQVSVYDTDSKTVGEISKKLKSAVKIAGNTGDEKYYAVINATPIGSGYYEDELACSLEVLKDCKLAVDLVVERNETPLVALAKKLKLKTVDGRAVMFFATYLSDSVFFGVPFLESEALKAFYEYTEE